MNNLIVTALLLVALPSVAQPLDVEAALAARVTLPDLPVLESVAVESELGEGIDSAQLGTARGREGSSSSADLSGVVSGNSATQVSTGSNYITEGSFANMSGLPVVIQNSGANVLIQNATVINLQLR